MRTLTSFSRASPRPPSRPPRRRRYCPPPVDCQARATPWEGSCWALESGCCSPAHSPRPSPGAERTQGANLTTAHSEGGGARRPRPSSLEPRTLEPKPTKSSQAALSSFVQQLIHVAGDDVALQVHAVARAASSQVRVLLGVLDK